MFYFVVFSVQELGALLAAWRLDLFELVTFVSGFLFFPICVVKRIFCSPDVCDCYAVLRLSGPSNDGILICFPADFSFHTFHLLQLLYYGGYPVSCFAHGLYIIQDSAASEGFC